MSASLVGSEMCIRDSLSHLFDLRLHLPGQEPIEGSEGLDINEVPSLLLPVSYTHLTLPTICSV
eukprot:3572392-Alexandrium_andersonii.AAC.1